ncbi:unnamed protein product [Dicrocoelium dendriticum]|nr:unnamed protein product [Dicrocoelium dendriticum]
MLPAGLRSGYCNRYEPLSCVYADHRSYDGGDAVSTHLPKPSRLCVCFYSSDDSTDLPPDRGPRRALRTQFKELHRERANQVSRYLS